MPIRVLVAGPPLVLEAVRRGLPEMEVTLAPELPDDATLRESDCIVVGPEAESLVETWGAEARNIPVVKLLLESPPAPPSARMGEIPCIHVESTVEMRLAVRVAIHERRIQRLVAELQGPWAHDARGALGVVRLAMELLKAGGAAANPLQKMENGLTRLGFLLERLPSQIALAVDLPLTERGARTLFPNLASYVSHLQLAHSRRPIELVGQEWAASDASHALVPFAAGFAELALKVSPARAKLLFSASQEHGLEVDCECPTRPEPWNIRGDLGALELSRRDESFAPYRLLEVARLALRSQMPFSIAFTDRGFLARAAIDPSSQQ